MSCPNFEFMLYNMPMIASRTYGQMAKDYEECTGEEFDADLYAIYLQDDFNEAAALADGFSKDLNYHVVTVQSGHYDGFQFVVKERYADRFDLDASSRYCIDNEDAHYYFDECRSKALRRADAEKRKIERWLNERAKNGYNRLVCRGVFSNGEALYDFA